MAKSSAAKKTTSTVIDWFNSGSGNCPSCGHGALDHVHNAHAAGGERVECPPLPPAKTDFERELAAASESMGDELARQKAERTKLALVHFDAQPGVPVTLDLEIECLRPMAGNPRGDELGDVSGLVKSIEMHGFIGTLFVREITDRLGPDANERLYEVWAGNRRLKAAKEAGLKVLPCDVYDLTEVQALELNMTEQINRDGYTPLQEGDACRRLMELSGYTEHQVAEKFGKSASWVTKRVQLCGIAPELRKAVAKGGLAVTLANALASLPTHQQQVKAYDELQARSDWEKRGATAEGDAEWIRTTLCRPLSEANFKLTDAELVPEAGACSACPHNSQTNKMPGLFDNVKAKPTCAKVECFDDKELAAWLKRTDKQKAAGAKVLSLGECKKLFARGNDLGSSSRYVEAETKPPKDKQGRDWAELVADVPEEHRPQLHLAQDNGGKLRQLYVLDKAMEAVATHLKARWAKNVVEEAQESRSASTPEAREKQKAEQAEKELVMRVRDQVFHATMNQVAAKLAKGFNLPAARLMAARLGDRALERFREATGLKKLPKDWVEKGATIDELLTLVWLDDACDELRDWQGYDERFLALAKTHGIDVEAATKAQLATAKSEAEKAAKP